MAEGLVPQPTLSDLMAQLQLLTSPQQGLGMRQQALPEPPAPDIGSALMEAGRAIFGPQFLASRAEVPQTLEELLGSLGPHAGLVGVGRTGIGETLRQLRRGEWPRPGRLDPTLAEQLRQIKLLPSLPPTTSFDQAISTGIGLSPRDPMLMRKYFPMLKEAEPIPVVTGELIDMARAQAKQAGQAFAAMRPEELETVVSVLARLAPKQQRLLASHPSVLAEEMPGIAVGPSLKSSADQTTYESLLQLLRRLGGLARQEGG